MKYFWHPVTFTLIELLVTITMMTVMVSLLLPALGTAREAGRKSACLSNLRQMGMGLNMYSGEQDGWMPWNTHWSSRFYLYGADSGTSPLSPVYLGKLYPDYIKSGQPFYCPSLAVKNERHSYSYNAAYLKNLEKWYPPYQGNVVRGGYFYRQKLDGLVNAPRKIVQLPPKTAVVHDILITVSCPPEQYACHNKDGGYNVLYLDGCAKWFPDKWFPLMNSQVEYDAKEREMDRN